MAIAVVGFVKTVALPARDLSVDLSAQVEAVP